MRVRVAWCVAALAIAVAQAAPASAAEGWPVLEFGAGTTLSPDGYPDAGGMSVSGAALWPVTGRFAFGVEAWADDIGSDVAQVRDVAGGAVGLGVQAHRWAWGAGWRGDARVWQGRRWGSDAHLAFGYGRIEDDRYGQTTAAVSVATIGAGVTLSRPLGSSNALGLAVRGRLAMGERRALDDKLSRWLGAGLTWRWDGLGRKGS